MGESHRHAHNKYLSRGGQILPASTAFLGLRSAERRDSSPENGTHASLLLCRHRRGELGGLVIIHFTRMASDHDPSAGGMATQSGIVKDYLGAFDELALLVLVVSFPPSWDRSAKSTRFRPCPLVCEINVKPWWFAACIYEYFQSVGEEGAAAQFLNRTLDAVGRLPRPTENVRNAVTYR